MRCKTVQKLEVLLMQNLHCMELHSTALDQRVRLAATALPALLALLALPSDILGPGSISQHPATVV